MPDDFTLFKQQALRLTGIDLEAYKSPQLQRRLQSFMTRHGIKDYRDLAGVMAADPRRLQEFRDFITINVTEFYRNPAQFDDLAAKVLPRLLAGGKNLKVWSAGCSQGAEIFTVALLLEELTPGRRHQLLGTDIDELSLRRAREARYLSADLAKLPERFRRRWFIDGDGGYHLKREIADRVSFRYHNLLKDPFGTGFDLILCRNVVIYFTSEARDRVFRLFQQAINPGGVLLIGGTEIILKPQEMGFRPILPFFYEKVG